MRPLWEWGRGITGNMWGHVLLIVISNLAGHDDINMKPNRDFLWLPCQTLWALCEFTHVSSHYAFTVMSQYNLLDRTGLLLLDFMLMSPWDSRELNVKSNCRLGLFRTKLTNIIMNRNAFAAFAKDLRHLRCRAGVKMSSVSSDQLTIAIRLPFEHHTINRRWTGTIIVLYIE